MDPVSVSAVIATRNRPNSLRRVLRALESQVRPPEEVIVVDASDQSEDPAELARAYPGLAIRYFRTPANLSAQRNLGIQNARGSHVLICDDDIEPAPDYLASLIAHLDHNPECGAVTGFIRDPDGAGIYRGEFPVPRLREVLLAFLFQRSLGGNLDAVRAPAVLAPVLELLRWWFRHRGNTWSLAGWPLITQVHDSVVKAGVYYLGASLVRREWLLSSPYDESLGPHSIGDNYGVATGLPKPLPIEILTNVPVTHHRDPLNRPAPEEAYYRRVLALNHFLRTRQLEPKANRLFLLWSLLGAIVSFAVRGRRNFLAGAMRATADVALSLFTRGYSTRPPQPPANILAL